MGSGWDGCVRVCVCGGGGGLEIKWNVSRTNGPCSDHLHGHNTTKPFTSQQMVLTVGLSHITTVKWNP